MRVGIAIGHTAYTLKEPLVRELRAAGHEVVDFGTPSDSPDDDYTDYTLPVAQAVAERSVERGIVVCDNPIGACIAANKIGAVRAGACGDIGSARQGVQSDNMNVLCVGAVPAFEPAWDLIQAFLAAQFDKADCHLRALMKIERLEEPGIHG
jgi:ribose 5-phosphate isomerase B